MQVPAGGGRISQNIQLTLRMENPSDNPDQYLTLSHPARSELRVSASRFFGFTEPVPREASAARMRLRLKKEYHDATHQPFAYRLVDGQERSSDDGEPKGTAGIPILSQIRQADLCDVQVVVVRYFGGTKLGKGGLVKAFSECARLALEQAGSKQVQLVEMLDVITAPENVNLVKAVASRFGAAVVTLSYDVKARLRFAVPRSRYLECQEALMKRFGSDVSVPGP